MNHTIFQQIEFASSIEELDAISLAVLGKHPPLFGSAYLSQIIAAIAAREVEIISSMPVNQSVVVSIHKAQEVKHRQDWLKNKELNQAPMRDVLPNDYQECPKCGYDHRYDPNLARQKCFNSK